MARQLTLALFLLLFAAKAFAQPVIGSYYPPTNVAGLANYKVPSGQQGYAIITDGVNAGTFTGYPNTCTNGQPAQGGGQSICRVWWQATSGKWIIISPNPTNGGSSGFTPFTFNGVNYGAGGTSLPTLNNPTSVTCLNNSGDASLLQTAINAGHDVLIKGAECDVTSTVMLASNQNIQCANSSTILYNPSTSASGPAAFEYNTQSNATFENCTFQGANTTSPPTYPGINTSSCTIPGANAFLLLGEGQNSNITVANNKFLTPMSQAAVEFYASGVSNANNKIFINWNSFYNGAYYAFDLDSATNSSANHNYLFDVTLGNEMEGSQTLSGTTVNYNYVARDQYGDGYGCDWIGAACNQTLHGDSYGGGCATNNVGAFPAFCGEDTSGGSSATGCSATGNIIAASGYTASVYNSTNYGVGSQIYIWNTNPSQNGGACYFGAGTNGCNNTTPPNPAPSGP